MRQLYLTYNCAYNIIIVSANKEEEKLGLFDSLKQQFRKVIQWENVDPDVIVWKYPLEEKEEIMRKSQLVVREGQRAMFIKEGQLADVFDPGTYMLDDIKNIPILTKLYNWKYAWESPYTGDVFFISTKQFIDQKWGTRNPVMMRDKDFGMIRFRAFGTYTFSVGKPTTAMTELFGSENQLKVSDVSNQFKSVVCSTLSNVVGEAQIPALDLAANYDDLSVAALAKLKIYFDRYGIEIKNFYIENISLPEEVEKMLDKRTNVGIMSDSMQGYAQMETLGAIRDAAKNPGGLASAGIGLGAGLGMGKIFADNMGGTPAVGAKTFMKCPSCGAKVEEGTKFCPECGKKMEGEGKIKCPACNAEIPADAKFCPDCGHKIVAKCPACGKDEIGRAHV